MKRLTLLLTIGAMGLGLSPTLAQAAKGDTLLGFTHLMYTEMASEALYRGPIHSDKEQCLDSRKVTFYRQRGGPDDKIGTAFTFEDQPDEYLWSTLKFKEPKDGTYYAKVAGTAKCKGDKSNTKKYPPENRSAAPAARAGKIDTFVDLTIIEYLVGPDETFFRGEIDSDKRKCLLDRKIVVFRKRSGDDEKIGKTEANEDKPGEFGWSLPKFGQAKPGVYYGKAPATDACKSDKSDTYAY